MSQNNDRIITTTPTKVIIKKHRVKEALTDYEADVLQGLIDKIRNYDKVGGVK